jgi:NADPH:quinone reductase-like Zn-dependent oxidoreductase
MSAAWINEPKAHPLEVKAAPVYTPGPNEILVRNRAVAMNPIDNMTQLRGIFPLQYPAILGQDVAGDVMAVGPNVTRFKEGDRVVGHSVVFATQEQRDGAFQTYTIVRTNLASHIPEEISFESASVLPLGLSTASCALFQDGDLHLQLPTSPAQKPTGTTVLIWGAASSVGCNAVQLAVAAGYEVVATASPHNFDLVKRLGASQVLDYHSPNVVGELVLALQERELAGAFDCIGFSATQATAQVVAASRGAKHLVSTKPVLAGLHLPEGVTVKHCRGDALKDNHVGQAIYEDFLPQALRARSFVPAPEPVVAGKGLESVQGALDLLQKGVSAKKVVVVL